MRRLIALFHSAESRRLLLPGALNAVLSYALYLLLALLLPYVLAYALAYALAVCSQFILARSLVYRASVSTEAHALAYPLLHLLLGGFGSTALGLVVSYTPIPPIWAGLLAIALQASVAFFVMRCWFASAQAPAQLWAGYRFASSALLFAAAGLFVLSAILAIAHLGFRAPLWDQFRSYQLLLDTPYPLNLLQPESGHRPLIPNLLKQLDLLLTGGRQGVLLLMGGVFALCAWAVLVGATLRSRYLALPIRALFVLAISLAFFWLGNARMLLHGNEAVAVYWVLLCLMVGLYALCVAPAQPRWTALAALAAALAVFGFGNGLVVGCALLCMAVILRRPVRQVAALALTFAASLILYTWLLPGSGAARAPVAPQLLANGLTALRWVSGAWIQAWLGLAEDPSGVLRAGLVYHEKATWLVGSADWIASMFGSPREAQMYLSLRIGALGTVALAWLSWQRWRCRSEQPALWSFGLGLAWFGLGTSLLVALGRTDYFIQYPGQIFAERYLPWSCMFWLGIGLAGMTAPWVRRFPRSSTALGLISVPLLACMLWPSHRVWAGWAQEIRRRADVQVLALSQDALIQDIDQGLAIPAEASTLRTLELLRRGGYDVFDAACPTAIAGAVLSPGMLAELAPADPAEGFADARWERLQGALDISRAAQLWVYDAEGRCIGRGMVTGHLELDPQWWFGRSNRVDVLMQRAGSWPRRVQLRDGQQLLDERVLVDQGR